MLLCGNFQFFLSTKFTNFNDFRLRVKDIVKPIFKDKLVLNAIHMEIMFNYAHEYLNGKCYKMHRHECHEVCF